MAVELFTPAEIADHLKTLKILLLNLPDTQWILLYQPIFQ
jgi:hypothetical protein